jgi:hypothetical protein
MFWTSWAYSRALPLARSFDYINSDPIAWTTGPAARAWVSPETLGDAVAGTLIATPVMTSTEMVNNFIGVSFRCTTPERPAPGHYYESLQELASLPTCQNPQVAARNMQVPLRTRRTDHQGTRAQYRKPCAFEHYIPNGVVTEDKPTTNPNTSLEPTRLSPTYDLLLLRSLVLAASRSLC